MIAGRVAAPLTPIATTERWPNILGFLVAAYAALLPYQVSVTSDINFAPADCCLVLIVLLAPGQLKYRSLAWGIWHVALVLVFAVGTLVIALNTGALSRYVLLNKDAGLVLLLLSYAAITSAISEWDDLRRCEGASWGPEPLFRGPSLLFCRLSLGMGILFTFSRSTWVSLAIALLLLCALRRGTAIRLALTGAAGAALFLLFMGGRFLQFFENMAARPEQGESRFELIRDALAAFARHPVFGGGLGSFLVSEGTIVHNTAVWFLAEFGILGLIVLVGYLASFFTMGWFAYRYAPPREKPLMLALLLGHTAMLGLAMGIEAFYQRHWWLVFALIGAGYSLARQQAGYRQTNRLRFAGGHQ